MINELLQNPLLRNRFLLIFESKNILSFFFIFLFFHRAYLINVHQLILYLPLLLINYSNVAISRHFFLFPLNLFLNFIPFISFQNEKNLANFGL